MSVSPQVNERLAALTAAGNQRVAGPDPPRHDRGRRARPHGRGGLAARRHLEPGDLREGDPRLARLRRGPRRRRPRGALRARGLPPAGGARRAARRRRAAPGLRRDRRLRRLRLARGRAAAGARHRGHARAGADVLGPGRPPERDDQDPRHRGGDPGDRAGAVRGHERQHHAAVRGVVLRARDGGVHQRMERRQAEGKPLDRHSVASFFVSRVDTEVDKRLEALGRSDLAGRAGLANARAAYRAFQRVFEGERFAAAARGRRARAAAAVGVDRRQEPGLPGDDVRLRPRRARHREHDAAADADRRRARGRGHRRDRGRRPDGRPRRAARGRHRPRRRHRASCCATASTRSWCR